MDLIYWDHYYDQILLMNLVIVVALFTALRAFSGTLAHIRASDELFKKDNPAFGISVAGVIFGITLILSGLMYGSPEDNVADTIVTTALYGVVGVGLLVLTRIIFDKITLNAVSIRNEIVKGNVAIAIADAGNVIASALIIRAVLVWITSNSIGGFAALFTAYALSQTIMTFITLLKFKIFNAKNKENLIQQQLRDGNIALALRFVGQKIGTAFAITIASKIVVTEVYEMTSVLSAWFLASIAAVIILKMISYISERIILYKVNLRQEVLEQRNVAVGALQAIIYISLGLLFSQI